MPTFKLVSDVTVSAYTEVDAETLEEAISTANRRAIYFSHCGADESTGWVISCADGEPQNIRDE